MAIGLSPVAEAGQQYSHNDAGSAYDAVVSSNHPPKKPAGTRPLRVSALWNRKAGGFAPCFDSARTVRQIAQMIATFCDPE